MNKTQSKLIRLHRASHHSSVGLAPQLIKVRPATTKHVSSNQGVASPLTLDNDHLNRGV